MRRLVWAFAGRTYQIVGNLMPGLNYVFDVWELRTPPFQAIVILHQNIHLYESMVGDQTQMAF